MTNEDYEERAAIGEFDGGLPRDEAEAKAMVEIAERKKDKTIQPPSQGRTGKRKRLAALLKERDGFSKEMAATDDPGQVKELAVEWQKICMEIIELRRES